MSDIEPTENDIDSAKMMIAMMVEDYGNDLEGLMEDIAVRFAQQTAYIRLLTEELAGCNK